MKTISNVECNLEQKLVSVELAGFKSHQHFVDQCESVLELCKIEGLNRILIDSTEMGALQPESLQYIQTDWTPKAFGMYKIQKIAFLKPKKALSRLSQKRANQGSQIPFEIFDSKDEALEWITQ